MMQALNSRKAVTGVINSQSSECKVSIRIAATEDS